MLSTLALEFRKLFFFICSGDFLKDRSIVTKLPEVQKAVSFLWPFLSLPGMNLILS